MAETVVTELVIDASPAEQGSARYAAAMAKAASAQDRFNELQARVQDAMSKGAAVMDATVQRTSRLESAYNKLRAQIDPIAVAEQKLARIREQSAVAASNAVLHGLTTEKQALADLAALDQKHTAQIEALRGAEGFGVLTAAVNDNGKAIGINRTQMLMLGHEARATFDILASGGSIFRALTLEGAGFVDVLAMGEGGIAGSLSSVADGLAGLMTPANLAIAAFVALGAGAVLWLTSERQKTFDATAALEEHKKWLDQTLDGYDEAKKAADAYLASAKKLPGAAVVSNLQTQQGGDVVNLRTALDQVAQLKGELRTDLTQGVEQFGSQAAADAVRQLVDSIDAAKLSASSSKQDFDGLITELTQLSKAGIDTSPIVAHFAQEFLPLVQNAAEAATILDSTTAAANRLKDAVSQDFAALAGGAPASVGQQGASWAADQLAKLGQDKAAFAAQLASIKAVTPEQKRAAAEQQKSVELDGQSISPALRQQQIAEAGQLAYAQAIQSTTRSYGDQVKAAQNVEDSLNKQLRAMTETDRQREIDNALTQAHTTATTKEGQQIVDLAGKIYDQKTAIQAVNDEANLFADTTEQAFEGLITGGQSLTDVLGGVGKALANAVIQGELLGQGPLAGILGTAPASGGGPGGLLGSIFSNFIHPSVPGPSGALAWAAPALNANGGVYASRSLSAYSNSIVTEPTYFRFASGAGLMGEAGPEAIMPLKRGADGKLGVAANSNGSQVVNNIHIVDESGAPVTGKVRQTRNSSGGIDATVVVKGIMKTAFADGSMDQVMSTYGLKRVGRS